MFVVGARDRWRWLRGRTSGRRARCRQCGRGAWLHAARARWVARCSKVGACGRLSALRVDVLAWKTRARLARRARAIRKRQFPAGECVEGPNPPPPRDRWSASVDRQNASIPSAKCCPAGHGTGGPVGEVRDQWCQRIPVAISVASVLRMAPTSNTMTPMKDR